MHLTNSDFHSIYLYLFIFAAFLTHKMSSMLH